MGNIGEIIDWTLTASGIVLLVFGISILFGKKIKKTYQCALWGIVLIRLLIPNMPSSPLSLFNLMPRDEIVVTEESSSQGEMIQNLSNTSLVQREQVENTINEFGKVYTVMEKNDETISKDNEVVTQAFTWKQVLYNVWLVGILVLGSYYTYSYIRAKRKIKGLETIEAEEILKVFESCKEKLKLSKESGQIRLAYWDTSMILGIKNPTITLPKYCNKQELEMILLHELTHYKYKEHWLTYIQLIALTLHWFNPIVWLGIKQMKEDIEYACDERVIRLGVSKKNYAETLLNMMQPSKQEFAFGQGMGDAPKQAKNRIQKIASLKQGKPISSILSMALVALLTVGCLTDGTKSETKSTNQWIGIQNVAMLGLDQDGLRTDTIVVARMNCENGDVDVVSIPRDTRVVLDNEEKEIFKTMGIENLEVLKINEIFAYGGEAVIQSVLVKELEKLSEVEINHYVLINLEEAKNVVNALGGIDVEIPEAMSYDDYSQDLHINIEQGIQHLDGEKTMQAVRYRRYPNGDVDRVVMTQTIMKGILESALELSSLEEFEAVVQSVKDTINTNMSLVDMIDYYTLLKKMNLDHISWNVLPGQGEIGEDGRSYYIVDNKKGEN